MDRIVDTNQRIYFDTNSSDTLLMSGGTSGMVNVWNLKECLNQYSKGQEKTLEKGSEMEKEEENTEKEGESMESDREQDQKEKVLDPICTFKAGNDCINGIR